MPPPPDARPSGSCVKALLGIVVFNMPSFKRQTARRAEMPQISGERYPSTVSLDNGIIEQRYYWIKRITG